MSFAAQRHARIVIIGGGVIGTSVAYHLARTGERDVLLLERQGLADGCSWHAAGLVGQLRGKRNLTRLMQSSVQVFDRLEDEVDAVIDWKKVGSLRLASSPERWSEIRRAMTQAKIFGVECHAVDADEAARMFPFIEPRGIAGAAFIPGDGYVDPFALTQAYAKGARAQGVRIEERTAVERVVFAGRRAVGVVAGGTAIGCEVVVNCAGLWARSVGALCATPLAAGIVEHQYLVTEKSLDLRPDLPTLRDPDNNFYLKPDVGGFAIGGWEDGAPARWSGCAPPEFGRELFAPDLDRLERFAVPAATRLPILDEIGIRTVINGPIPVSADGEPVMGLAPERDNVFVACGFTAGIAASGGAGEAMAHWIVDGDPGMDLWPFDVRRFGPTHAQSRYLDARAAESYAAYYKIHWPGDEPVSARGARRSPLHGALAAAGAVYGSKAGWERPNWFAPPGVEPVDRPSFEQRPGDFNAVHDEVAAVRERVGIVDQTSFAKLEVSGPGAFRFLQRLAANDLAGGPGRCVYTQLCNARGGIEADLTVMHVDDDRFYVVTGAGFGVRDGHWLRSHLPPDGSARVDDVTSAYAVLNLCGPRSRDVLARVCADDVGDCALPPLGVRRIEVGLGTALAARIGYTGELGYELHTPVEYALHVYEALWQAGLAEGMANVGYRAVESMRLEKGHVYWSADVGPEVSPYEAGLGFCVALDKGDFIGRAALGEMRARGPGRRLRVFSVDGFAPLHGGEAILHDGKPIGTTTSAGYGHTVGRTIAYGFVPHVLEETRDFEIEAFGKRHRAVRGPRALHDPVRDRLEQPRQAGGPDDDRR